jgi:hypothetical protein
MPEQHFSALQVRLLLKCAAKPMSKSEFSNFHLYKKSSPAERKQALEELIQQGLLLEKSMPKEGVNKIPTFYFVTDKGQKWLESYRTSYPKK